MKKLFLTAILFCLLLLSVGTFIYANEARGVRILVISEAEQYTNQFDAQLKIIFTNDDLYNDKVKLSYHVYNEQGKEILWEGQRVFFLVNEDGVATQDISIDLNKYPETSQMEKARIKFDLIDEKNGYWFSTSPVVSFSSDEIWYENNFQKKFFGTLKSAVADRPIIFIINVVLFFLFIYTLIQIKRKSQF